MKKEEGRKKGKPIPYMIVSWDKKGFAVSEEP